MASRPTRPTARALLGTAGVALGVLFGAGQAAAADPERGAYIFNLAGCKGCHTEKKDGALLAGGRALKTPFGVFYSPNITPDPETGIGRWSDEDFIRALRDGQSPDGDHFFPAFPYPSYTAMSEQDMRDLKAYIFTLPPVRQTNRDHDLQFPFSIRALVGVWKALYFTPGPIDGQTRGAYLAETLGHCGECHTPRGPLGGPDRDLHMAGAGNDPEGAIIPNITPDRETGIGKWTAGDLGTFFVMGMLPDGDFAGSTMGEVISNTTSKMTKDDRAALISYLQALPPIHNRLKTEKKPAAQDW